MRESSINPDVTHGQNLGFYLPLQAKISHHLYKSLDRLLSASIALPSVKRSSSKSKPSIFHCFCAQL
nr:hypothetical protein Iba_chr15aCG3130 [Ipomoea batatas]